MLLRIKKKCYSLGYFFLPIFFGAVAGAILIGGLSSLIGPNPIVGWILLAAVALPSVLALLFAIAGGVVALAIRVSIRKHILKECDLARIEGIQFITPRTMQYELYRKKLTGAGTTSIPLVVFGCNSEVRDTVYCAEQMGMTVYGIYRRTIAPGHSEYHRPSGTTH